jgi:hypothetical protein
MAALCQARSRHLIIPRTSKRAYLFPLPTPQVTFLERKFVAADMDRSGALSSAEWMRADFPESFVPDGQEMTRIKYFYYGVLMACTGGGAVWSPQCVIDVRLQDLPPFSTAEVAPPGPQDRGGANITEAPGSACAGDADCTLGRGCSYFGYCRSVTELAPQGVYARYVRWKSEPSGLAVDVWQEVARRLGYNYTWTLGKMVTLEDAQVRHSLDLPPSLPLSLSLSPTPTPRTRTHVRSHYSLSLSSLSLVRSLSDNHTLLLTPILPAPSTHPSLSALSIPAMLPLVACLPDFPDA